MKYSKSKILDFINCGRLFYFRYMTTFGKQRKQSSPELERGSILHEVFEAYNTDQDKFEQYFQFIKDKPDYLNNLSGFLYLLEKFNLGRAEYAELYIYNEDINISGYVDAIYYRTDYDELDEDGDPIVKTLLIDYKTGKYKQYKMAEYRMELYIYEALGNYYLNMLYNTVGHMYIDEIGMFFTNDPDNSFIEKVSPLKRNNAMKKLNACIEKIEKGDFTKVGNFCRMCSFKDICDDYTDEFLGNTHDHVLSVV